MHEEKNPFLFYIFPKGDSHKKRQKSSAWFLPISIQKKKRIEWRFVKNAKGVSAHHRLPKNFCSELHPVN